MSLSFKYRERASKQKRKKGERANDSTMSLGFTNWRKALAPRSDRRRNGSKAEEGPEENCAPGNTPPHKSPEGEKSP